MSNPSQIGIDEDYGSVVVERDSPQKVTAYWLPSSFFATDSESSEQQRKLVTIDREERTITVFPTNLLPGHKRFLKSKHNQVESIAIRGIRLLYHSHYDDVGDRDHVFVSPSFARGTPLSPEELDSLPEPMDAPMPVDDEDIERVLQGLPPGFTKDIRFGLGLAKQYWPIVEAVERLSDCTAIVISHERRTGIDEETGAFGIAFSDFDSMRKALNRIARHGQNAARALKETTAYNTLAERLDKPTLPVKRTSHKTRQMIADALEGKECLDDEEQSRIVEAVSTHLDSMVTSKPELTAKLHADIELATLDRFIESFRQAIDRKQPEPWWQNFFTINPIALNLVFGCPVVTVHGQASVGGRRFSGKGDRIADFLVKNAVTNNVAIVEIKTPSTPILNKKRYRDSVYTPSNDLSGAIGQVLDQKRELHANMAQFKDSSRNYNVESYSIRGCVIIGVMPDEEARRKAVELCRGNSKDVDVITYDELLEKTRQVRDHLMLPDVRTGDSRMRDYDDLPF